MKMISGYNKNDNESCAEAMKRENIIQHLSKLIEDKTGLKAGKVFHFYISGHVLRFGMGKKVSKIY